MTSSQGGRHTPSGHQTARHRSRAPRVSRLGRATALVLTFLLAFATSGGALAYNRFQNNIDTHDIGDLLGTDRPTVSEDVETADDAHAGQTLNLLFMGTDSREGDNAELDGSGTTTGMRADTTLLVQVPADRKGLTVVSIPRDTLVDIPACTRPDGTESYPQSQAMFNSAFNTGSGGTSIAHGAACTIKTVEALTGVLIDDFVVVDFAGFIGLIDALDGIPMYVEEDITSKEAQLELTAGCQILDGADALGFARVRKGVSDGSDIARIGRQQDLLMAVIEDALSSRVLTNPAMLYEVADAATQTITTGRDIGNLTTIVGLAYSMRNVDLDQIQFITMPFDWAGDRVVPSPLYAEDVWQALRTRQPVDPRLSGVGWEITEQLAKDEAAEQATDGPTDDATDDPTSEPTGEPTDDAAPTIAPTDEPTDPAATCTRETAKK